MLKSEKCSATSDLDGTINCCAIRKNNRKKMHEVIIVKGCKTQIFSEGIRDLEKALKKVV